MLKQIVRFRELVEAHFEGRPGPGDRYPEPLRALAVEVASTRLAEGWRLAGVAEELGISTVTLQRWIQASPAQSSSLRPVDIIREDRADREEIRSKGFLTLVTVAGHRIEGLALAEVALLLESLGWSVRLGRSRPTPSALRRICAKDSTGSPDW